MFTKKEIWDIAAEQSAWDINCSRQDFFKKDNIIVPAVINPRRRVYYSEPVNMTFVSYGSNIVVYTKDLYRDIAKEFTRKFEFYHCFETPNIHWLDKKLAPLGQKVCFMAEYFLPDPEKIPNLPCWYETRILEKKDFEKLYLPQWSNALCRARKQYDMLAVAAFDKDKMIGMAGCSADRKKMWQIGIDVLPEYRGKGIACALTSALAKEILNRGKVPFYCRAWSNIASKRNAIKRGFVPRWVEMTVKPTETVEEMNR